MVKFQSQATADLVMLQKHAHVVLGLIGKSEDGPGILETKDMPAALSVLKGLPQEQIHPVKGKPRREPHGAVDVDEEDDEVPEAPPPDFIDESISLRQRVWPLVNMIERAMKEQKPIMWNVTI
jgi:hypothetical protein